jgi:hypothetical protein
MLRSFGHCVGWFWAILDDVWLNWTSVKHSAQHTRQSRNNSSHIWFINHVERYWVRLVRWPTSGTSITSRSHQLQITHIIAGIPS